MLKNTVKFVQNTENVQKILSLIHSRDVTALEEIMKKEKIDPNFILLGNESILTEALSVKPSNTPQLYFIKELVEKLGCCVQVPNTRGTNPFIYGCISQNEQIIDYLIERGCDVRQVSAFSGCHGYTSIKDDSLRESIEEFTKKILKKFEEDVFYNFNIRYQLCVFGTMSVLRNQAYGYDNLQSSKGAIHQRTKILFEEGRDTLGLIKTDTPKYVSDYLNSVVLLPFKARSKNLCALCSKRTTKRCSRCKEFLVCSTECQKECWIAHRWCCGT